MVMRRSKKRSRSAYGQESCDVCIRELRQTLKKLRGVADITCALAIQMARLRKLREAVQKAEEATAHRRPKQRHRVMITTAYRVPADAPGIEAQLKHRLAAQSRN